MHTALLSLATLASASALGCCAHDAASTPSLRGLAFAAPSPGVSGHRVRTATATATTKMMAGQFALRAGIPTFEYAALVVRLHVCVLSCVRFASENRLRQAPQAPQGLASSC